jgi:predicted PurR-regulated permease PerM
MIYAKSVLIPLTWALMIALASANLVDRIKKFTKLPFSLVILLYLILIFAIIGGISFFFSIELQVLLSDLGMMQDKLSVIMHSMSLRLKSLGFNIPDHYDPVYFKSLIKISNETVVNLASGLGNNLWNFMLIIFYTFFLLFYKDLLMKFAESKFKDRSKVHNFRLLVVQILEITRQYIAGMFILGIIIAILSYFLFIAFGLKAALFFAIFFGILSLIPVIGVPMGMIVIGIFALLTKDSFMTAVYVALSLVILNFLQDNVIRPMIMGSKLSVNAFAVFFFVIVGGFFWGVSGMILFIPLASILKIILDRSDSGSHYAVFLSELPKIEKPKKKHKKISEAENES